VLAEDEPALAFSKDEVSDGGIETVFEKKEKLFLLITPRARARARRARRLAVRYVYYSHV
jgi:hypothetical protein